MNIITKALLAALTIILFSPHSILAHGDSEGVYIHMNEHGFEPNDITINVGETVVFENIGENEHWPASDLHPTHAIYSDFDPLGGVPAGESWEFTFDKPGTWQFHDHLYPENVGVIKVLGEPSSSSTPSPTLRMKLKSSFLALGERFKLFVWRIFPGKIDREFSTLNAFDLLQDENQSIFWIKAKSPDDLMNKLIEDSGQGLTRDCHNEAHVLGRLSYSTLGSIVFGMGTADCHSGFYHGAMEGFLQEQGTDDFADKIRNICDSFASQFGRFECLHGVGHGVMAYEHYDLPKALETCSSLPDQFSKNSCYGGVFMENIVASEGRGAATGHETTWVSEDPHYPCNAVGEDREIVRECYQMQTSRMLNLLGWDYARVSEECAKAPADYVPTCFLSLGRDAAGSSLRDPQNTLAICSHTPDEYYLSCIGGAVQVVIDFWGENIAHYPYEFCSKIDRADAKEYCYTITAQRLPGLFANDRQKIEASCKYAEDFEEHCLDYSQAPS